MLGELIRRAGPPEAVPELVARRVRRNVEQAWLEAQRRRRRPWIAAAAAVLAVVAATLVVLPGRLAGPAAAFGTVARVVGGAAIDGGAALSSGDAVQVGDRIVTGADDALSVAVAGSASLRVAANTSLVVEAPRRLRLARGAVYIDSGSGATVGDAFEIQTPFGRFTDVGTQFLVRLDEAHAEVLVREGLVDVAASDGAGLATLAAGRAARVDDAGQIAERGLAADDRAWDWAEALATPFAIEGASLYDFLAWAARETGRELSFASDAARRRARSIRLSGDIGNWQPEEAIAPVVATAGMSGEVTVTPEKILVR